MKPQRWNEPQDPSKRERGDDPRLDFHLPPQLEADRPPELRGIPRDRVRLLVSHGAKPEIVHSRFDALPEFLEPGDLLVVNASRTIPAALPVRGERGERFRLHLSTPLPGGRWLVEVRVPEGHGTVPFLEAHAGDTFSLPAGGRVMLETSRRRDAGEKKRLWVASLSLPIPLLPYLDRYGLPVRYRYAAGAWPISAYRTLFGKVPGSVEMPSAGRAFTPRLVTLLRSRNIGIAPIVLHTGLSSLEADESPHAEFFQVPARTAKRIVTVRRRGHRIIAVGTTVVRALESVTGKDRIPHAGEGWTDLVVTPRRGLHAVDGLITGFHEPRASHLAILTALCGLDHLEASYRQALRHGYRWHEFGDLHLILPSSRNDHTTRRSGGHREQAAAP
ncbi:MAG: S-adenosylmethionine:tRNA ribosyltransferase-isomerase [Deltaproteobacteria bacterium]|nr:MAG: S-adenosylmethionine:tRNA ribosyltransferase-isomerase [Deltaproteobacteria bacterium]